VTRIATYIGGCRQPAAMCGVWTDARVLLLRLRWNKPGRSKYIWSASPLRAPSRGSFSRITHNQSAFLFLCFTEMSCCRAPRHLRRRLPHIHLRACLDSSWESPILMTGVLFGLEGDEGGGRGGEEAGKVQEGEDQEDEQEGEGRGEGIRGRGCRRDGGLLASRHLYFACMQGVFHRRKGYPQPAAFPSHPPSVPPSSPPCSSTSSSSIHSRCRHVSPSASFLPPPSPFLPLLHLLLLTLQPIPPLPVRTEAP
jgi:hypothetical protein